MDYFGLVINPRNGVICEAVGPNRHEKTSLVKVYLPDATWIGSPYLETDDSSDYYAPAQSTGFPRVHTPDGVAVRGAGFGTTLYAASSLRAHLHSTGTSRLKISAYEDGISSQEEDRSAAADQWWERAKKIGLAEEVVRDKETFSHKQFSCARDDGDCDNLLPAFGGRFHKVRSYKIDAVVGTIVEGEFDILQTKAVEARGLILGIPDDPDNRYIKYGRDNCFNTLSTEQVEEIFGDNEILLLDSILAINTGIFGKAHWNTVRNIVTLAKMAGASLKQIQQLTDRYEAGIDIEVEPFAEEPLVRKAASKPKAKSKSEVKSNPGRSPRWTPVHYERVRNPPDKAIQKNIEELAERRTSLGWDKLSDLP